MELNYQEYPKNPLRVYAYADWVKTYFYRLGGRLVFAEECYFAMMQAMRRMRMHIPLDFTLENLSEMAENYFQKNQTDAGILEIFIFRKDGEELLTKRPVKMALSLSLRENPFQIAATWRLDLMKELIAPNNFLSCLHTASPENVYSEIYATENGLNDVMLMNRENKLARTVWGNLLLIKENAITAIKPATGAYLSPMLENFVTFLHKDLNIEVKEAEVVPFETQKAEEILVLSDQRGIFSVGEIRNKTFGAEKSREWLAKWKEKLRLG